LILEISGVFSPVHPVSFYDPMTRSFSQMVCLLLLAGDFESKADLTPAQVAALPPPADQPIVFSRDIQPLLQRSCVKCHGNGKRKGGFSIDTRETLLKGGESGPAIVPGKSEASHAIELVTSTDPEMVMPKKGSKLKPAEISLLRAWIDQGAAWETGFTFKKPPVRLEPRRPEIPSSRAGSGLTNPIDLFLQSYFETNHVQVSTVVSDRLFQRRVTLDVIGLLPTPEEMAAFEADKRADKRERLVDSLLADSKRYAENWLTFWNDALRNDYKGTGYIDGGRKQITPWLYAVLATNLPFDEMVRELINPTPASEGFVKGIVWRGVVNASQRPEIQAAQNISQVFMGVNLKCASCHDSFINDWELADAYGLAGIYADHALEMYRCDKPTGEMAKLKFLYPELGAIDADLPHAQRLKQLAEIMTQQKNGRLGRTMVNRLWARFLGRGLVEPVDEMDNPPWHADLLDWLAADFAEHHWDLKHAMRRILTSQAYQLPAVGLSGPEAKEFVFRGPVVRRLSAEQFADAISEITGIWGALPANTDINFQAGQSRSGKDKARVEPRWIWTNAGASSNAPVGHVFFRKFVYLPRRPSEALVLAACDNEFKLFVNGKEAGSGKEWSKPKLIDVRSHLVEGLNLFAVAAENSRGQTNAPNPAGFNLYARIRDRSAGASESILDFGSDSSWLASDKAADGWQKPDFKAAGWLYAVEAGGLDSAPWNLKRGFEQSFAVASEFGKVRAALRTADPLMVALGRPNREQVITMRPTAATTLQALELTNGRTLAEELDRGASQLVSDSGGSGRALVERLYQFGLGRKPTAAELEAADQLVGERPQKETVADLLWAMTMLPEFQLIY